MTSAALRRIVLLADVGGSDSYHVGDESMLDAAVLELRRRGDVEITVISADPHDTAERYFVQAIEPIGFSTDPGPEGEAHRDRRLAAALALGGPGGSQRSDTADAIDATGGPRGLPAVAATIAASDAVIVTGGGNLSSTWPHLVYERVAALSLAHQAGIPAVVTSQTVGPDLTTRQAALLAEALGGCRLVGLRERASLRRVSTMLASPTPRRLQLDDAIDLPGAELPETFQEGPLKGDFIGLTVNPLGAGPQAEAGLDGLASLVCHIQQRTERNIVVLPHVGRWSGEASDDIAVGEALRARVGDDAGLILCPLLPARQMAELTRRASAIVSTRYHPLVFGLSAGVPCLGIYQDSYTFIKVTGALDHAGLGGWVIPVEALKTDVPARLFDELWSRRGRVERPSV